MDAYRKAGLIIDEVAKKPPPIFGADKEFNDNIARFVQGLADSAAKIRDDLTPAYQKMNEEIRHYEALLGLGMLKQEEFELAALRSATKVAEFYGQAGEKIVGGFGDLFKELAKGNKELVVVAKGLAIAEATFQTYVAANKALAIYGPTPIGFAAMAAAIASGIANVLKITSTSFASGGSFMVPGGFRGSDNIMVPLNLASGERVDVTSAEDVRRGGSRGIQEIVLRSPRARDFFADHVRDLVEVLNLSSPDGYKLRFADHP